MMINQNYNNENINVPNLCLYCNNKQILLNLILWNEH